MTPKRKCFINVSPDGKELLALDIGNIGAYYIAYI